MVYQPSPVTCVRRIIRPADEGAAVDLKPAEFVIIKLQQMVGQIEV